MKTKNKALLLALCAVSLVTASVLGTMAYLTDDKTVTNTFTVGSVAITMDETDVDGTAGRDTQNSYKLLPGQEYKKDPIIHVADNSEDCYLFVKVENEIADIEKADSNVASQMATNGWKVVEGKGVYVYVGTEENASTPAVVHKKDNIKVFDKIVIDGSVNGTQLKNYDGKNINVTAYAVQKAGFEDKTPADIWAAAFPNA